MKNILIKPNKENLTKTQKKSFLSIFPCQTGPKIDASCAERGPGWAKIGSKMGQESAKIAPRWAKMAPRWANMASKWLSWPVLAPSWGIWAASWINFEQKVKKIQNFEFTKSYNILCRTAVRVYMGISYTSDYFHFCHFSP